MKEKKEHNNYKDEFSEKIKQKLDEHQFSVDENIWMEIESKILPKKKNYRFWWIGISTAAAIALFLLFIPFFQKDELLYTEEKYIVEDENIATDKNSNLIESSAYKQESIVLNKNPKGKATKKTDKKAEDLKNITNDIIITKKETIQNDTLLAPEENFMEESILRRKKKDQFIYSETESTIDIQKSDINDWSIAPYYTLAWNPVDPDKIKGRSEDYLNSINYTKNSDENMLPVPNRNFDPNEIIPVSDFQKSVYHRPLSFGLLVQKGIDTRISIESGVIYTFLFSKFEKEGIDYSAIGELSLHYLGLPVTFKVNIFDYKKLNGYISAGAMIEKGITSVYSQRLHYKGLVHPTRINESIKGIQFSLSSSLGVSYKIQQSLGIYFEPKLSYFFPNNQPKSIRTENKLVFGLNIGIRYELD